MSTRTDPHPPTASARKALSEATAGPSSRSADGILTLAGTNAEVLVDVLTAPRCFVGINDEGRRVGQDHHRARLTDADVDLIHALKVDGMQCTVIAQKFDCSVHSVYSICQGRRRIAIATGQRAVRGS